MTHPLTLLEATRQAVVAAAVGDLAALEQALEARQIALEDPNLEATPAKERMTALKEGETLHFLLSGIRRQIADQQGHLERMRERLHRTGPPPVAMLNIKA